MLLFALLHKMRLEAGGEPLRAAGYLFTRLLALDRLRNLYERAFRGPRTLAAQLRSGVRNHTGNLRIVRI
jgi:hypothetical protein